MKTANLAYIVVLICISFCCAQQNRDIHCSEYNNKAVESLQNYLHKGKDTLQLIKSFDYYTKAIDCYPLIAGNYMGKLMVSNLLERYGECLKLTDQVYSLYEGKNNQILVTKAVIFERLEQFDSSKFYYDKASKGFNNQLSKHPPDSIRIICDRLYLTAITEGKQKAIEQLNGYLIQSPEDPSLIMFVDVLRDFDRKVLIPDKKTSPKK